MIITKKNKKTFFEVLSTRLATRLKLVVRGIKDRSPGYRSDGQKGPHKRHFIQMIWPTIIQYYVRYGGSILKV